MRQKASLAPSVPFGLIALDGHQRRPIATPILALLAALSGREVAIVTDPPLLVFDVSEVPLPELPPDWIRVRSGPHAGREGRLVDSAGLYRFRCGHPPRGGRRPLRRRNGHDDRPLHGPGALRLLRGTGRMKLGGVPIAQHRSRSGAGPAFG